MAVNDKKGFVKRNKVSLGILAIIYLGLIYILNFACFQNSIHIVKDEFKEGVTIQIIKK